MSLANDSLDDDMVKLVAYTIVSVERGYERVVSAGTVMVTERMSGDAFTAWMIARYMQTLKEAPAIPPVIQDRLDRLSERLDRDEAAHRQQISAIRDRLVELENWAGRATAALNQLTAQPLPAPPANLQALSDQLQNLNAWIADGIRNLNDLFVQPAATGAVREQLVQLRGTLSTLFEERLTALGDWIDQTRQALSASQGGPAGQEPQIGILAPPEMNAAHLAAGAPAPVSQTAAAPAQARLNLQYLRIYFVVSTRWPKEPLKFHEKQVGALQDIRNQLHC